MERTLKDTFNLIDSEKLLLPDFQRDYKWNASKQQSLLASILLNFPVGSSLILEGNAEDFALRKIGETTQFLVGHNEPCEYLLDGQQRTTTLYNALNDSYDFTNFNNTDELSDYVATKANPMKVRWFLRIPVSDVVNEKVTDIFGARKLKFDKDNLDTFEPDEIMDIFSSEVFNEKNNKGVSKWFSPFYQVRQCEGDAPKTHGQITTQFVNDCIERGLLPLFSIGDKPLVINRVLKGIVDKNAQIIRDKYEKDFEFIKNNYDDSQVFDGYDSIEDFEESTGETYQNQLDDIFSTCKNHWQNEVKNYLVKDIYETYKLSSIVTNDIRRAIPIFCHLNDGGMPLDDFDLVSAKAAKKLDQDVVTYSMSTVVRDLFKAKLKLCDILKYDANSTSGQLALSEFDSLEDGLPKGYVSNAILAICTALANKASSDNSLEFKVSKKDTSSKTLLSLKTTQIREYISIATVGVQRAFSFLLIRCGVYNAKKLHYKLMLQPIAYALAHDDVWKNQSALNKIEFWYWSSAFSGRYLYDQSAVVIEDINQLYDWVKYDKGESILERENKIFLNENFSSKELLMLESDEYPKEGIHSLILQYVLSNRDTYDLLSDKAIPINSYNIDTNGDVVLLGSNDLNDHHIIPLGMVTALGQKTEEIRKDPKNVLNSPLNRVLISNSANLAIKAMDPARYFEDIYKNNIVLDSQLIGSKSSKISTTSSEDDIKFALDERFELIKNSVEARLLKLKS